MGVESGHVQQNFKVVECDLAICQVHMSAYPPAELTMAGRGDDETSFKQLSCQQLLAAKKLSAEKVKA